MKKKIIIISAVLTVLAVCAIVTTVLLLNNRPLDTPVSLTIEDDFLKWEAVPNANGYMVDMNDELFEVKDNVFDILELTNECKTYTFKVYALSKKGHRYDSELSESIYYTIPRIAFQYKKVEINQELGGDNAYEIAPTDKNITGKIIIPSEIDGKPVIQIGGFNDCINITSVYIPDSVAKINTTAFRNCTNLTRARLPKNLDKLSSNSFENSGLKTISIPQSVTTIAHGALASCNFLTELVIPEGVENLGYQFILHCDNLESIKLPKSLKNTETPFFCKSLSKIEIDADNRIYKTENNC